MQPKSFFILINGLSVSTVDRLAVFSYLFIYLFNIYFVMLLNSSIPEPRKWSAFSLQKYLDRLALIRNAAPGLIVPLSDDCL